MPRPWSPRRSTVLRLEPLEDRRTPATFVVTNKDVLKKEIVRRRLLQQNEQAPADSTKK